MKKEACIHQQQICRFTRWSGKSYSAFNSIGKQVSIGVLSCSISNTMGVKSSVLSFHQEDNIPGSLEIEEEMDEGFFSLILSVLELLFLLLSGNIGANLLESQSLGSDQRLSLSIFSFFLLSPVSFSFQPRFSRTKSSIAPIRISIGGFFNLLKPNPL